MLALKAKTRKHKKRATAHKAAMGGMEREEQEMLETWVEREGRPPIAACGAGEGTRSCGGTMVRWANRQFAVDNRQPWDENGESRVVEVAEEVRRGTGAKRAG